MIDIEALISIVDAYKEAAGVDRDSTVAFRVFGDSKKNHRLARWWATHRRPLQRSDGLV